MSKLIWYKPPEHGHKRLFLDYIDADLKYGFCLQNPSDGTSGSILKYKYYCTKWCCALLGTRYFLPQDIWKYILFLLCDNIHIDEIKILEWFDVYFKDEYQKLVNPLRLEPTWTDALSSCRNNESYDIYYAIINVPVVFSEKDICYRCTCPVGRAVCSIDLILGIDLGTEKLNKSVKNMYIETNYFILNDKSCPNSLFIKYATPGPLGQGTEKETIQTFLTLKDYMPICSYSAPYSEIHFNVELDSSEKLDSINILCGYMNNKLRYKLDSFNHVDPNLARKRFIYKKCIYTDGILYSYDLLNFKGQKVHH